MKGYYDTYWSNYGPTDPFTAKRVARFLSEIPKGARVLDAGCGRGDALKLIRAGGVDASGVDISATGIELAKAACPTAVLKVASFEEGLPFVDGSFDAIYSGDVIEHVYDTGQMARELQRVLRPGGLLFISTPYHGFAKNLVLSVLSFDHHFDPQGPHVRFFSDRTLRQLLQGSGFNEIRTWHLGRFWPFWANLVAIAHRS